MNDHVIARDVIIVGAGGSGLAAAIEAAQAGGQVTLLEKGERIGGTTGWSVGSITASGTPHQRRAGIIDSADHHFEDLGKFNAGKGDTDNLALRRILVDESPAALDWLTSLGVEFVGPSPEPPHRVPRMHNVVPSSAAFAYHLSRACQKLGVEIRCASKVVELIHTEGSVTGVRFQRSDGSVAALYARKGVILTAGDFAGGRELKARYFPPEVVEAAPVNPLSNGDGMLLAEALGARVVNGGTANAPRMRFVPAPPSWLHRLPPNRAVARAIALGWRWLPAWLMRPFVMRFITTALGPEPTLFRCGAKLVDPDGNAIQVDLANIARHLPLTPQNIGYIVFDAACAEQLNAWPNFISTAPGVAYAYLDDYRKGRPDIFNEASSITELAQLIGAKPDRLMVSLGERSETSYGPFFALGPVRGYVTITEGGLAVDTKHRVLDMRNQPIRGLFAAGSTGQGGLLIEGHGHHLGWAFVSGRRAGRSVMGTLQ